MTDYLITNHDNSISTYFHGLLAQPDDSIWTLKNIMCKIIIELWIKKDARVSHEPNLKAIF